MEQIHGNYYLGYVWKYLYTIKPSDIVKFDSADFIPLPSDWATNTDVADVRNNAVWLRPFLRKFRHAVPAGFFSHIFDHFCDLVPDIDFRRF